MRSARTRTSTDGWTDGTAWAFENILFSVFRFFRCCCCAIFALLLFALWLCALACIIVCPRAHLNKRLAADAKWVRSEPPINTLFLCVYGYALPSLAFLVSLWSMVAMAYATRQGELEMMWEFEREKR